MRVLAEKAVVVYPVWRRVFVKDVVAWMRAPNLC